MMLTNFFSKSKPINYILILGLFVSYFLIEAIQQFSSTENYVDFFLQYVKILGLFLFLFFFVNFIISKNNVTFDNSYAFLFFVLLIGLFPATIRHSKEMYVTILLLLAIRKVYSFQNTKALFQKLFDAGFWFGIAFLLAPFSVVYLLVLYVAVYIYQKITIQILLIPLIGFLVPVFLCFTYCFWYDKMTVFEELFVWKPSCDFEIYVTESYFYPLLFIGVGVLISLLIKTPLAFSISNTFKKTWAVLIMHFLVSVVFVLLLSERNGAEILFLFFPVAIILANGLEILKKRWLQEFILWLFFIGSFINVFAIN